MKTLTELIFVSKESFNEASNQTLNTRRGSSRTHSTVLNMQFVCVAKWKKSRYHSVSEDKRSPTEGCTATDHCTSSSCEILFFLLSDMPVFSKWAGIFICGLLIDIFFFRSFVDFLFFVHSSLLLLIVPISPQSRSCKSTCVSWWKSLAVALILWSLPTMPVCLRLWYIRCVGEVVISYLIQS